MTECALQRADLPRWPPGRDPGPPWRRNRAMPPARC